MKRRKKIALRPALIIRMEPQVRAKLKRYVKGSGFSMSGMVVEWILRGMGKPHKKTRKAKRKAKPTPAPLV